MTEREKLIELISQVQYMGGLECKLADHLLSNGVIVPPCKVGDKVYRLWSCGKKGKSVAEFVVAHIDIDRFPDIEVSYCNPKSKATYRYYFSKKEDFGKTVFLTKEEAEKALKERGEGK